LIIILVGIGISGSSFAQTGGKKRERKAKRRGDFVLGQYKSRGHADEFARGNSGRRGWWARIFKKEKPAWQYKRSGSRRSQYKENRFLFFRHRSQGREDNAMVTEKQNKERAKKRERGNKVFKFKKYKRKK
jgi:hypothetical protein